MVKVVGYKRGTAERGVYIERRGIEQNGLGWDGTGQFKRIREWRTESSQFSQFL